MVLFNEEDEGSKEEGNEHAMDASMHGGFNAEKLIILSMNTTINILTFNYTNLKELNKATKITNHILTCHITEADDYILDHLQRIDAHKDIKRHGGISGHNL